MSPTRVPAIGSDLDAVVRSVRLQPDLDEHVAAVTYSGRVDSVVISTFCWAARANHPTLHLSLSTAQNASHHVIGCRHNSDRPLHRRRVGHLDHTSTRRRNGSVHRNANHDRRRCVGGRCARGGGCGVEGRSGLGRNAASRTRRDSQARIRADDRAARRPRGADLARERQGARRREGRSASTAAISLAAFASPSVSRQAWSRSIAGLCQIPPRRLGV